MIHDDLRRIARWASSVGATDQALELQELANKVETGDERPAKTATQSAAAFALELEREYQRTKWSDLDPKNSPADFLVYISVYLHKAMSCNDPSNPVATLTMIRKIAALGLACMELHGAGNLGKETNAVSEHRLKTKGAAE